MSVMDRKARQEYEAWLELRKRINLQTEPIKDETRQAKEVRIKKLLNNFSDFCKFYFPHYVESPFGYFHKEAARHIAKDKNIFAILEWPREHAKSVFADVLVPLWLKAKGEMTGMMICSANQDKAATLLGDIQAELLDNRRYITDFGQQEGGGSWQEGYFVTADGTGFWSFGRKQSPRGVRKAAKRPNYAVVDDIDDKEICNNKARVKDAVDWVLGDYYGALSIKGARLIVAGNRIHKGSILAYLVGDVEPDDPKRKGIWHSKVFAIEDEKRKEASADNGQAAWKERYTLEELLAKMEKMGYRNAQREFFHKHIEDGDIFKPEHIVWTKCLEPYRYEALVTYVDPSFKDTRKSDYKALVLMGRTGKYYDIIFAWCRQASVSSMVKAHYDIDDELNPRFVDELTRTAFREVVCPHYIEANFLQDLLVEEYENEGEIRNYQLRIRQDKRKKPDKYGRIENLEPLFERHLVRFNEKERKNPDMITLKEQFLGFPNGHDDGPDAVEGAIHLLTKQTRTTGGKHRRAGKYKRNKARG